MTSWEHVVEEDGIVFSNWDCTASQTKGELGTILGKARICGGRRYYEVSLDKIRGVFMVGWVQEGRYDSIIHGVGCHKGTWAIDQMGSKGTENRWSKYGSKLKPGSVIGCALDLVDGTMSFSVDGRCLGVAFTGLANDGECYRPAVSIKFKGSQITANFGAPDTPFQFLPDGMLGVYTDGDNAVDPAPA